ncbi:MAG: 3-keto-disaccharide hydrolase [Limisphaerales bacterium]
MKKITVLAFVLAASLGAKIFADSPSDPDTTLIDTRDISEKGFKKLSNGKDLEGWDGSKELWSIKDGCIIGQTTAENPAKENTFLIWTNGVVGDFELRCSYKIIANNDEGFANSGIQYRSKIVKPEYWVVSGYQADLEAGKTYSGILYEEKGRGILAQRGQKTVIKEVADKTLMVEVIGSLGKSEDIQAAVKKEGWNDYVIIAKGNHLQHFINGKQTIDVTDQEESKAAKSGILALQLHAGKPMTVQFKNIRIKMMK